MSRRRQLSDEERALWHGFARSITPLRPGEAVQRPEPAAAGDDAARHPAPPSRRHAPSPAAKPLAPFDRRLKQRVARGRDAIEAHIDLHGMTQRQAHIALLRFLRRAQADGTRIALVVTGKGKAAGAEPSERGVLRRQVPMWLALPEFRPFVIGFDEAHASHGGQGALYVRLRRAPT